MALNDEMREMIVVYNNIYLQEKMCKFKNTKFCSVKRVTNERTDGRTTAAAAKCNAKNVD
jgi:hypothetical protein